MSLALSTLAAVLDIPDILFHSDAVVIILNLAECLVPASMATTGVTFPDNRPCL